MTHAWGCRVGAEGPEEERADGWVLAVRIYHAVAPCTSSSPGLWPMPFLPKGDLQKRNLLSYMSVQGSRVTQACKQVEKTLPCGLTSSETAQTELPRPWTRRPVVQLSPVLSPVLPPVLLCAAEPHSRGHRVWAGNPDGPALNCCRKSQADVGGRPCSSLCPSASTVTF